jgi:GntR family transcriptional regulator/MocR family aminotransferase
MQFHVALVGRKHLSREIYQQLRRAITDGRLRPGDGLPPSRELARSLKVSRNTVTVAYDRLAGEGFLGARVGAGTFVSHHLAPVSRTARRHEAASVLKPRAVWDSIPLSTAFANPARFDFRTGLPDPSLFPHKAWRRLMGRALRGEAVRAGAYIHPAGHPGLREAIARHIAVSRGVQAGAENVVITSGAQQALDLVGRVLLTAGDRVAVEDPGYLPPRFLFKSLGARVQGVPVDGEGLVVDAIPRNTRLVYVTPSHQYPLGITMSLPRRLALLDWATRNDAVIVEDDYDSEFRFEERPIEPLQTLDASGRVLYIGSFSKTLSPALRLGFVVGPGSCISAFHKAKYVADWHTSTVVQAVMAEFIESGGFAHHIRRVCREYTARHAMIAKSLGTDLGDRFEVIPSAVGLHMAALVRSTPAPELRAAVRRASRLGVEVQQLAQFTMDVPHRQGLVLGYGAIPTSRIREGLHRLKSSFDEAGR